MTETSSIIAINFRVRLAPIGTSRGAGCRRMASIAATMFEIGMRLGRIIAQLQDTTWRGGGRNSRWNLRRDWILFVHRLMALMV